MPGQFVDVVAVTVASPTTLAPTLKEPLAVPVPIRGCRSQSLSTLPRRASTASVLTVENNQSDTFTEEEELEFQSQQHARHARRALSSGAGSSLSLLQQELGYPRRARVTGRHRHRRGSLLENTTSKRIHSASHDSSHEIHSNCSSSGSVASSSDLQRTQSVPEPEGENQINQLHYHGRSWTFNAVTCSPRSEATGAQIEEEEDENFMNYRSASVTGYSRDTDGVVYYEVIVRSTAHGPLSAYKVRRRYSELRDLHAALSKVMPVSHRKLASVTAMASISDENNEDEDAAVGLRFSVTDCGEDRETALPPLPDKGGVWSYLQFDSIPLLERRAKYFHAMLAAAQRHPAARASRLLNDFVGTPPDLVSLHSSVENSYVSLNRFAAPKLSFDIEIQERKEKAKSIRRRRSSLKRQSFTGSLDASFNSPRPSQ
ncbi:PX domain-containing protein [Phytophthora infestans]|uniref:PX domain-containing protein n=1 Tax=Phytophthora infestans TaxID=4787 RepID=A0A833TJL4_PHYIN|nr:PX domain-containing protein [Phytophthora infestans]